MADDHPSYHFGVLYMLPGVATDSHRDSHFYPMMDANIVISKCIEAIYEAAAPHKPIRVGTIAGRVLPKSDGSQVVKIRVNINYANGQEKFAPIDCTIDNVGNITIKEHHEP